jgi:hypothetical protein
MPAPAAGDCLRVDRDAEMRSTRQATCRVVPRTAASSLGSEQDAAAPGPRRSAPAYSVVWSGPGTTSAAPFSSLLTEHLGWSTTKVSRLEVGEVNTVRPRRGHRDRQPLVESLHTRTACATPAPAAWSASASRSTPSPRALGHSSSAITRSVPRSHRARLGEDGWTSLVNEGPPVRVLAGIGDTGDTPSRCGACGS